MNTRSSNEDRSVLGALARKNLAYRFEQVIRSRVTHVVLGMSLLALVWVGLGSGLLLWMVSDPDVSRHGTRAPDVLGGVAASIQ